MLLTNLLTGLAYYFKNTNIHASSTVYYILYTIQYTVLHSKWLTEMASFLGNIKVSVCTVHNTVHCTLYLL